MKLLSVLCKCKIYYLNLIIILEFSNQFWTSVWGHTHYIIIILLLKIYQNHIIMGIIFFSITKISTLVFSLSFQYLFCQSYLYLVQIHTSF